LSNLSWFDASDCCCCWFAVWLNIVFGFLIDGWCWHFFLEKWGQSEKKKIEDGEGTRGDGDSVRERIRSTTKEVGGGISLTGYGISQQNLINKRTHHGQLGIGLATRQRAFCNRRFME
jgi:hypothetical protein